MQISTISNEEHQLELVVVREFDAPLPLVFETFSKAEHLQHWWGPVGFQLTVLKFDFLVNGHFLFKMESTDGFIMYGLFTYQEIQPPHKVVYTLAFADEQGNKKPAPFEGPFPLEIHYTWTFKEQNGKTIVEMTGKPCQSTTEEKNGFKALLEDMKRGFNASLDALNHYLATQLK